MFKNLFKSKSSSQNDLPAVKTNNEKKKRKRSRKNSHESPAQKKQKHKSPPSEEAMLLSSQLKLLSSQKRLQEAIDLYWDVSNDNVRDEHHACIVIDCCGRCGNIAEGEKIVQKRKENDENINVQTKTALLKGYAHSGMIRKAALLYEEMMQSRSLKDRPNIRTFNTMLRGCLWTAATTFLSSGEIHGGVVTSEHVWRSATTTTKGRNSVNITPDASSYEYSIVLLCQALCCKEAENRIKEFTKKFGIRPENKKNASSFIAEDASTLETLSISFLSLARAYALLGKISQARIYVTNTLSVVSTMYDMNSSGQSKDDGVKGKESFQTKGGKRGWKATETTENSYATSRREISNKLFREHRINEIKSEANLILNVCERFESMKEMFDLPFYLATRVLYFSGGGTTDLSANCQLGNKGGTQPKHDDTTESQSLLLNCVWSSFGLSEAIKEEHSKLRLPGSGIILSQEHHNRIKNALGFDVTETLQGDGCINFSHVFSTKKANEKKSTKPPDQSCSSVTSSNEDIHVFQTRPLYLELGAGFGEWSVLQARNNPSCDYVAVELRSDRVGQMFAKAMLNEASPPLENICCIGAECGSFLRSRIKNGSVSKIFVNHPEPPTQTYGSNFTLMNSIAAGGKEPAHMLNSETLLSAIRCLDETSGELVIVTDNRFYANLLCSTLLKVMVKNDDLRLYNKQLHGKCGIQQLETFQQSLQGKNQNVKVILYEGRPGQSIGHYIPDNRKGGSTYFDRLWQKGAGTHAETDRRFIIVMSKSECKSSSKNNKNYKSHSKLTSKKQGSNKRNKKNSEKQKRRNERRLLKKAAST